MKNSPSQCTALGSEGEGGTAVGGAQAVLAADAGEVQKVNAAGDEVVLDPPAGLGETRSRGGGGRGVPEG